MPTTHRTESERDLEAVLPFDTVLVRVEYQLRVPVPTQHQDSAAAAEAYADDHLNRLPVTDHDEFYVEGTERTTYTAQEARW